MLVIECDTCKLAGRCAMSAEHRAKSLFAVVAHCKSAPECLHYQPKFYHGIEGVLSPLPPSVCGANQCN